MPLPLPESTSGPRKSFGLACLLLLAACGGPDEAPVPATPPPETLAGTWAGVFPCDNCAGIDTTLWLRSDGRFLIEQQYAAGENEEEKALTAHGLGRWRWDGEARRLVLEGRGPQRIFERPEPDSLVMLTASPLEHRLQRRGPANDFTVVIRLNGMARQAGDGYLFTECLTGYAVPLEKSGDYTRFARQFRKIVPPGESAPVEVEGRFAWGAGGAVQSLRVEKFITLRAGGGCG